MGVRDRLIERRLDDVVRRLRRLREELRIVDEQLEHLSSEADDSGVRAAVSESPMDAADHREARRHAEAMAAHRADILGAITELERRQDELLDRYRA